MSVSQQFFRAAEAATLLRIAKSTFWRWVADGRIAPGRKIGGRVTIWSRGDLDAFLNRDERQESVDAR